MNRLHFIYYIGIFIFFFALTSTVNAETTSWSKVKDLPISKDSNSASLLPNGNVLIVGNNSNSGLPEGSPSIEFIYNPTTDHWTTTISKAQILPGYSTNVNLNNGNTLVIGYPSEDNPTFSAQIFNSSNNLWSTGGVLAVPYRNGYATVKLSDGKVLVTGGTGGADIEHNDRIFNAEIYDPSINSWYLTGSTNIARQYHTLTLLRDGKVLETGYGGNSEGYFSEYTAEIYNPSLGKWMFTESMQIPRIEHTATLLPSGKVLVTGGSYINSDNQQEITAISELYDPLTGHWTRTGSMNQSRRNHRATLLKNGKVLVSGGDSGDLINNDFILKSAEIYDPANGTWSSVQNMNDVRSNHSSTLLADGKVIVVGGEVGPQCCQTPQSRSVEIYDPEINVPPSTPPCVLPNFGDASGNTLRQKDSRWENVPYGGGYFKKPDGTKVFLPFRHNGNNNDTIGAWGCKLTSAVMIINYFAKEQSVKDSNGNIFQTDPKKLNEWLQQQDSGQGYFNGQALPVGNPKYWDTAFVDLPPIVKYAKNNGVQLSNDKTLYANNSTKNEVNNSLCALNPVILAVNSNGHFVAGSGKVVENSIDTWKIHDPLWDGTNQGTTTLKTGYNNQYGRVDFMSGNKPKRHLRVAKYSPIEMYITDPQNRRHGLDISTNFTFEEIPDASYGTEYLAAADDGGGLLEYGLLDIPDPIDGKYILTVTGTGNGSYGLEFRSSDSESDINSISLLGYAQEGRTETYQIEFDSNTSIPIVTREVTFEVLKSDMDNLYIQGLIKNKLTYNTLKLQVLIAERATLINKQPIGNKLAIVSLKTFQFELNKIRGKSITEEAYQILYNDSKQLIINLQNTIVGN